MFLWYKHKLKQKMLHWFYKGAWVRILLILVLAATLLLNYWLIQLNNAVARQSEAIEAIGLFNEGVAKIVVDSKNAIEEHSNELKRLIKERGSRGLQP